LRSSPVMIDTSAIQSEGEGSVVRTERVFCAGDWLLFSFLSLWRIAAVLVFFYGWLLPVAWWSSDKAIFTCTSVLVLLALLGNQIRWMALPAMRRPVPMRAKPGLRVAAVTTFVPDAEPPEIVAANLRAMVMLEYPHDTWLLDEGDTDAMRELCASLGVQHFSRKGQPRYQCEAGRFATRTKHGNYNSWLNEVGFAKYDVMLAFDPDHVPVRDYALWVLGYFEDLQVAYVQSPQVYRNQDASLVAHGAAEETYGYYSATEMASFAHGAPVLIGCHNAQRLSSLREFGGLPDHSGEDLLQTVYYRQRGWRGVYVPKTLATGLAPEDWSGYLTQQVRWARSVFDIKFRHLPCLGLTPSLGSFVEFLQGFGYLQDAVIAAGTLALVAIALSTGKGQVIGEHLVSWQFLLLLSSFFVTDLYRQRFYLQPATEAGFHWRAAILRLAKWPFTLKSLYLIIRNQPFRYVVTPKLGSFGSGSRLLIPHGSIALLIFLSWVVGRYAGVPQGRSLIACAVAIIALSISLIVLELGTHVRN
jgi:cellulose synthase/poly-beta-1,6-N-acetylglucosamine synthase-like glycosyltransferase